VIGMLLDEPATSEAKQRSIGSRKVCIFSHAHTHTGVMLCNLFLVCDCAESIGRIVNSTVNADDDAGCVNRHSSTSSRRRSRVIRRKKKKQKTHKKKNKSTQALLCEPAGTYMTNLHRSRLRQLIKPYRLRLWELGADLGADDNNYVKNNPRVSTRDYVVRCEGERLNSSTPRMYHLSDGDIGKLLESADVKHFGTVVCDYAVQDK
jgi:hypothetical protein